MSMKSLIVNGALEPADKGKLISLMAALKFSTSGSKQKGNGHLVVGEENQVEGQVAIKSIPEPHLKQSLL